MKIHTVTFLTVTLVINNSKTSEITLNSIIYDTERSLYQVPNSSLLLLDRINLSNIRSSDYARKRKQNVAAANSTEPSSSSSSRPCSCSLGVCKCCTGLLLDLFNQKACVRITYIPGDFAFDVAMTMNDRVLYENSVSGKNPNPMCISPPRMPNLKVCAKFYNVFFPGRNFHFCVAMTGEWRSTILFNLTFECLRMGANGIAMLKPEDNGGILIPNPLGGVDAIIDQGYDDIEDYDDAVKSLFNLYDK